MKYLCSFILAMFLSLPAQSTEYRLPFVEQKDGATKIPFIEKEWILSVGRDEWDLYLEKGLFDKYKETYEFHAVTAYKIPYDSDGLKTKISKIYTYGVLNCNQSVLHILYEWYVDPEENMIFRGTYEFGSYAVEMETPDTARNEVYNLICKEMI